MWFKRTPPPTNTPALAAADVEALWEKVKRLEITSRKLTNHLFTGAYHTAFKGRGMNFKEVRDYTAGDDIRFIDWNTSARHGHTFTKTFEEERELNIFLLLDVSASTLFGTQHINKQQLAIEIAAAVAFSAIKNNDNIGTILFSEKVEKYIPPRSGRQHVLYLLREMLVHQPHAANTNIVDAIRYLNGVSKHKSIVFIISDFADAGYEQVLQTAARRHDIIGIQLYDPADQQLPKVGRIALKDAETQQRTYINTNDPAIRVQYEQQHAAIMQAAQQNFRQAGAVLLQLSTTDDYILALQKMFRTRA
ncbi:MAG: DUF58 domain-containing protein [Chitinophagaceae bacterium]